MYSTKVFVIIGVEPNHRNQAADIFRDLSLKGNEIAIFGELISGSCRIV